ncbi:DUF1223 domain-containing protein [Phaeobacter marinintestinus]|uniref:DUF1223 domain-containing protein n=1 Tax=Falsiphaeobacter marinintestinus TaxID=1492905 RepID=UPI0011B40DDC|nr:DUF1223 domain-containing protein [Phaeobacter marinintestinus]
MKRFFALFAMLCALAAAPVAAQTSPVVVELYTSQGCSSCPPADALLKKLTQRDDVLPLALHVDYWDYLGWKDKFADPSHAVRQKGFARVGGRKMVYTPQMIVMGQEDVVGAHGMELADLISAHSKKAPSLTVDLEREGGDLTVRVASAGGPLTGTFDIHLVRFTPYHEVKVKRGENAGRVLGYANVVDGWSVLGQWDPEDATEITVALDGDRPAAILVQRADYGPILGAAVAD